MFNAQGIDVVLFDRPIDTQFAAMLEQQMEGVKFQRVDSELAEQLKSEGENVSLDAVKTLFEEVVGQNTKIEFSALKDEGIPAILTVSEQARRMEDMMRMYSLDASTLPTAYTLMINSSATLIKRLDELCNSDKEKASQMASYIYKLSLLSQKKFSADEMQEFMRESVEIMMKL